MTSELDAEVSKLAAQVTEVSVASNEMVSLNHCNGVEKQEEFLGPEWGFDLDELYKVVMKFYKEQSGKIIQMTYSERCHLVALTQQASHGPYDAGAAKTLGIMDVVGRDRRLAWQSLGHMSANECKLSFIKELHRLSPTLKPYVSACWADQQHQIELEKQQDEERERKRLEAEALERQRKQEEEIRRQQENTKREIQHALNQQTFSQFRAYAEHQFPSNPEQQAVLIRQLQDQHYQQYMQQVYQQQLQRQQALLNTTDTSKQDDFHQDKLDEETALECPKTILDEDKSDTEVRDVAEGVEEKNGHQNIAAAAMWTRKEVQEFKNAVQEEGPNTILRVGHGETVTVRVPTHQDGSCLFWEFATDDYDIGFGLYFEWLADNADNEVTVVVTESDEEDETDEDGDDEDDYENVSGGLSDVERGSPGPCDGRDSADGATEQRMSKSPPHSVIIPIYRRDCHKEVYAGSHAYPGSGVYLLKFDNSYSVWRSKTLYYRVYYTQ